MSFEMFMVIWFLIGFLCNIKLSIMWLVDSYKYTYKIKHVVVCILLSFLGIVPLGVMFAIYGARLTTMIFESKFMNMILFKPKPTPIMSIRRTG